MSRLHLALACLLSACGLLSGCASDGVLELSLDLPANSSADRIYGFTQARDATTSILDEWNPTMDLDGVELGTTRTTDHISLRSASGGIDVNVKVTFCSTPRCTDLADATAPQLLYTLERPVYVGRRTRYTIDIPTLPTTRDPRVMTVDKCDISGCVGGELRSYCRADGTHFCE